MLFPFLFYDDDCFAKSSVLLSHQKLNIDKDVLIQKSDKKMEREYLRYYDSFSYDFVFVNNGNNSAADLYIYQKKSNDLRYSSTNHIYTRNGGVWSKLDYYVTLEDFGAISDGVTDCSKEISLALNSGLIIRAVKKGIYLLRDTVRISANCLDFKGFGTGRTTFLLDHVDHGLVFDEPIYKNSKKSVYLSDFTIKRFNSKCYKSSAGPKGLYVANASPLRIFDVEECYGIGYGIHVDYSKDIIIGRCHVHNHQYGMGGSSGTDGIHVYRSESILVENNVIHDVGDDAISTGSFESNHTVKDVVIKDNYIYDTKSGIKVYSFASNVHINNNRVVNSRESGVYLTDDKNSIDGSRLANIIITNNFFSSIGSSSKSDESGALRIRFWPNENTRSFICNITFKDNKVLNCLTGVSVLTYNHLKKVENIHIENNFFKRTGLNNVVSNIRKELPYLIRVAQCYGNFLVSGNNFHTNTPFIIKIDIDKIKPSEDEFRANFIFVNNIIKSNLEHQKTSNFFINFSFVRRYFFNGNAIVGF